MSAGEQDLHLVYRPLIPKDDDSDNVKTFKEYFGRKFIFLLFNN